MVTSPVTMPLSLQYDFVSKIDGKAYRVQIAMPFAAAPPGGYPAIYVTDGYAYFATVAENVRLRSLGGRVTPAVVIGISYPEPSPVVALTRRFYDLTPTDASASERADDRATYGPGITYGGADRFVDVIQREIKPRLASFMRLNSKKATLVGHSLGGLFVLRTLFRHPDYFASYVALSPSIWWEDRVVLRDEAAFEQRVRSGAARPVIFLSVDGLEQTMTQTRVPPGYTRAKLAAEMKRVAMVDNAVALGGRLSAVIGKSPYHVTFHEYAGREHVDAMWAAVDDFVDTVLPL